jgi:predicted phosphodiesterase
MQVAVFSDVHGNLTALQAVLSDIEKQNPDYIVFAGDLSIFGAHPAETIRLLCENRHIIPLFGNTDEMILEQPVIPDDASGHQREHLMFKRDTTLWVLEQLNAKDFAWLKSMSFSVRLSPTSQSTDDLLVVHANPKDVHRFVMPPADEQKEKLGSIQFEQSNEELDALLNETHAGLIAYGHFHFPNVRKWGDLTLSNISSVSNPMDGDTRAKYGLMSWDKSSGWQVEIRRVKYDIQHEQAILAKRKPPRWENLSNMLDGELYLG